MNGFLKGLSYPDGAGSVRNTFSWATDLGSGAMNAYSFYLYGSPFSGSRCSSRSSGSPYLISRCWCLKFAAAGGGAYLYLRRYVQNQNYAVLGAVLYAFSGWGLYNIFFNHFIDVLALFPWMLWALDETIYNGRHGLFAFWVGINLLNNYFFFIGQVLFLLIYFLCKVSAGDLKLTPRLFGHLAFESVLGAALGFVILWPAVLSLLQNPRTIDLSSGWGFLTYSKPQQYLAILLSWILPPDSPYMTSIWSEGIIKWTSMTAYLPLCSLAGAVAYWQTRQGDSKKRIVGTCAVFALVPVLNSGFYALNSSYYARWFYMPVLILAAMTVNALEDPAVELDRPAKRIGWLMIATLAFALVPVQDTSTKEWTLGVLQNPGQYAAVLGFGLAGLLVYRFIARRWRQDKRLPQRMLAAVLAFSCLFGITHIGIGKFGQWNTDSDLVEEYTNAPRPQGRPPRRRLAHRHLQDPRQPRPLAGQELPAILRQHGGSQHSQLLSGAGRQAGCPQPAGAGKLRAAGAAEREVPHHHTRPPERFPRRGRRRLELLRHAGRLHPLRKRQLCAHGLHLRLLPHRGRL